MTKPRRDPGYRRLSDSELNARALENRSTVYAGPHERSLATLDRLAREPKTLNQYVYELRKALRDETPIRLHRAGEDNLDSGGVPEMTGAFLSLLDAPSSAGDTGHWYEGDLETCERCKVLRELHNDPAFLSYYRTPYRAAMAMWEHALDPRRRRGAQIVKDIVEVGLDVETAMAFARCHPLDSDVVAFNALRLFWRAMSPFRLNTRRREAA